MFINKNDHFFSIKNDPKKYFDKIKLPIKIETVVMLVKVRVLVVNIS